MASAGQEVVLGPTGPVAPEEGRECPVRPGPCRPRRPRPEKPQTVIWRALEQGPAVAEAEHQPSRDFIGKGDPHADLIC